MDKTFTTEAGTELPLIQLKGKDYLQVAHRLVWFNEKEKNFAINTDFVKLDDEQTVCRAVVTVIDASGARRSSTATKRETKADFSDHTEKAETGAIGRCLALLGYGTQFATADLDEGSRIVDSPMPTKVVATKLVNGPAAAPADTASVVAGTTPKATGFKRITKPAAAQTAPVASADVDI